jgi:hypothetical protein
MPKSVVNPAEVVEERRFSLTNVGEGNNKF